MKLSLSKSLFAKSPPPAAPSDGSNLRILYKLESRDSKGDWLCSYRNFSNLTHKYSESNFTVPSFLKFAGFLLDRSSSFDPNNLDSLHIDAKKHKDFYLLALERDSGEVFSLNDSFSCYKVSLESGSQVNALVPLEDITWVEDDDSELRSRGFGLLNVSLALFSKLHPGEEGEHRTPETGLTTLDKLPGDLKSSVLQQLKSHRDSLSAEEPACTLALAEPFEAVKDKLSEFYASYALGFGHDARGRKHALVVSGEYEDCQQSLRLLLQNNALVPLEDLEGDEGSLRKHALAELHSQLSRLCAFLESEPSHLCLYVSSDRNPDDEVLFKMEAVEEAERAESKPTKSASSGKKTASKGKGGKSGPKPTQSSKKSAPKRTLFDLLPLLSLFGTSYLLKFDTKTGAVTLSFGKTGGEEAPSENPRTNLSLVFKFLMSGPSATHQVPLGGAAVPLFNYLSSRGDTVDGVTRDSEWGQRLKFSLNPYEMADKSILISVRPGTKRTQPHRAGNAHPPWISPKKSTVYTVEGNYQYYHYTQCGVNDTGWGCCYRSLQLVCSWYLLQYHTPKPVPSHATIQRVLKENDLSHKDLRVGSSTWIGTVESGYFLNWYLDFAYKTLYLNDVSEFRNYNVLVADHLRSQGSPVIVGAGSYAYVILGICLESEQGEVAYLIADPHYTGEDSVKNVLGKGGIGWKKLDFLSKAAEGKFINLCLPLLDKYGA